MGIKSAFLNELTFKWNPQLPHSIRRVSFYRSTVGFVRWLKQERGSEYDIMVTGHSLGGKTNEMYEMKQILRLPVSI